MFPHFCAIPTPPGSHLLKPFATVPLQPDMEKAKVAAEKSWYHHDCIALPLFSKQQDPNYLYVPIREGIQIEGINLVAAWWSQ